MLLLAPFGRSAAITTGPYCLLNTIQHAVKSRKTNSSVSGLLPSQGFRPEGEIPRTHPSSLHEKRHQLTCVNSVITENQPHAHHESHLHTMNVVTILIPSSHGLR